MITVNRIGKHCGAEIFGVDLSEFQYEHHWRAGDLLMWDNIAVQHKANFNYRLPLRRLMYRTTVRGTAPY